MIEILNKLLRSIFTEENFESFNFANLESNVENLDNLYVDILVSK